MNAPDTLSGLAAILDSDDYPEASGPWTILRTHSGFGALVAFPGPCDDLGPLEDSFAAWAQEHAPQELVEPNYPEGFTWSDTPECETICEEAEAGLARCDGGLWIPADGQHWREATEAEDAYLWCRWLEERDGASVEAAFAFSGLIDYWGGDGSRWEHDTLFAFAIFGPETTLKELVEELASEAFLDYEESTKAPWREVEEDHVLAAILNSLTNEGRAAYEAGDAAGPCEFAQQLDDDDDDELPVVVFKLTVTPLA